MVRVKMLGVLLVVVLAAGPVLGQVSRPAGKGPLGVEEKYTFGYPQAPVKDIQENCRLSDEQARKIGEVQAATKKKVEDYQAAHAEELTAAHKAMNAVSTQGPARLKLTQKVRELEKPMTDAWEQARFDILAVLTREQAEAWRKACVIKSVKFVYGKITFTPEQMKKIGALYDELAVGREATFEGISAEVMQKVPGILNGEQKQRMGLVRTGN